MVSACVLIRSQRGTFDEVVDRIKQLKGVERIFPVLGRYDVVVDIEVLDSAALGGIVLRMSRMVGVVFTETLVEVQYKEEA